MPIYQYRCTKCGKVEEVIQNIKDKPLETCSDCQGRLEKLITWANAHFKGSGFFCNDYKKRGK